jgi:hypothetical protein
MYPYKNDLSGLIDNLVAHMEKYLRLRREGGNAEEYRSCIHRLDEIFNRFSVLKRQARQSVHEKRRKRQD